MADKKRMANLELLRCVAMMMVVVLHYLNKGKLLPELSEQTFDSVGIVAWLLEILCIVAVNVYMFISGYFLCTSSFKLSRLIGLWFQVWFYSVTFGLVGALTGVIAETPVDIHYFLTLVFPINMEHYWFLTAYIYLYLLLPFVGMAVKKMTKQQLQVAIIALFLVFSVMKSLLPIRLEMDEKGYDCLWYLCVFLAAAYVRRFGVKFIEKKGRSVLLYVGSCLLIFAGTMALRQVYLATGSLKRMLGMFVEYNHILAFLAAVGLAGVFLNMTVNNKIANVINKISPYTLGVYLLHENLGLRYTWQKWLGAERVTGVGSLLLWTLLAVVCVFACGILVDRVRSILTGGVHGLLCKVGLYRKLVDKVEKVDGLFQAQ